MPALAIKLDVNPKGGGHCAQSPRRGSRHCRSLTLPGRVEDAKEGFAPITQQMSGRKAKDQLNSPRLASLGYP